MKKSLFLAACAAALTAAPVSAQTTTNTVRDRIGQILGNLLGVGTNATASLEGQWTANRRPLGDQRYAWDSRVDSDVRSGALTQAVGTRLKSDYYALVQLEARYGQDGSFTTTERSDLTSRYNALLQVLNDRQYSGTGSAAATAEVANGQAAFDARVDAQVQARRITRAAATRLKSDYAALIRTESNYLGDGTLSASERDDLDARLDALDQRVGDTAYATPATAKSRLDAIAAALPSSGLTAAARAQLLVEHGDLVRLEAAYARTQPSAADSAYLESRIANLETRAKVRR